MEQTGARVNIPPQSAKKDEITIAGEKEGVAKAKETVMEIYEEKKRKTTTVSIEVKKSQHKYVIGPRGGTLQEILTMTGKGISCSSVIHCPFKLFYCYYYYYYYYYYYNKQMAASVYCPRRVLAQMAKTRGGTLEVPAY